MNVIWFLVLWFAVPTPTGVEGELHIFTTPEACETWKANYLEQHDPFDGEYVISKCKPKEIE